MCVSMPEADRESASVSDGAPEPADGPPALADGPRLTPGELAQKASASFQKAYGKDLVVADGDRHGILVLFGLACLCAVVVIGGLDKDAATQRADVEVRVIAEPLPVVGPSTQPQAGGEDEASGGGAGGAEAGNSMFVSERVETRTAEDLAELHDALAPMRLYTAADDEAAQRSYALSLAAHDDRGTGFVLFDRTAYVTARARKAAGEALAAEPAKPEKPKEKPKPRAAQPPPKKEPDPPPPAEKPEPEKPEPEKPDTSPAPRLVNLGTLGGAGCVAYDINEAGHVVGEAQTPSGDWHAFIWKRGVMTDLGPEGRNSCAFAIGDGGHIVGMVYDGDDRDQCEAAQWDHDGRLTKLADGDAWESSRSMAVTPAGLIFGIGLAGVASSATSALEWHESRVDELAGMGSQSAVLDVNADGAAAGYLTVDGRRQGVVWAADGGRTVIETLAGKESEAQGINNGGDVVGLVQADADDFKPFLFRNGNAVTMDAVTGLADAIARGVNDAAHVVGYAWDRAAGETSERAIVWRGGSPTDLNTILDTDSVVRRARRINNKGQIAASGVHKGERRGFLVELEPRG